MFDAAYFLMPNPPFGPLAWMFLIVQIVVVAAGAYLAFFRRESNGVRRALNRQLGIVLLIVASVGVLLGVLRLANVAAFAQRYWFYIQLIIELGLTGYIVYYLRRVYPKRVAQSTATPSRSRRATGRTLPVNVSLDGGTTAARPVASTGRKDARRSRKRKKR